MFALVDVNNFYASCEQLFDPKLRGRPLVVLSNNDGCVVARSAEARAIGIPMAAPWFKVRDTVQRHGGIARSSNYALYADMSDRVVEVLSAFSPNLEVYSIDESFLDVDWVKDRVAHGRRIRERVSAWLGLPVCVGIAPTKTLAKLANHIAKKRPQFAGVCDLDAMAHPQREQLLAEIDVGEVWGVGPRLKARLAEEGITTVAGLRDANVRNVRERYSVVLERTARELRGEACADLEMVLPAKKEIISSRTFGGYVQDLDTLRAAVSVHASRAAEKLRAQGSVAGSVSVFIRTNTFKQGVPQYARAASIALPDPSADTPRLVQWALRALERVYRPGFDYRKAGVTLRDIESAGIGQLPLLSDDEPQPSDRRARFNATLDSINRRWGRGTARMSVEAVPRRWQMARDSLSPSYTTDWKGIAGVR